MPSPLLSRAHVAELLDVNERTVRRWGAEGLLDERRIGPHTVRVTAESVEALVAAGGQQDRDREADAA